MSPSSPTEVVCPSGFKPSVTPSVILVFIGSFFGYSAQLKSSEGTGRRQPLYILTHPMTTLVRTHCQVFKKYSWERVVNPSRTSNVLYLTLNLNFLKNSSQSTLKATVNKWEKQALFSIIFIFLWVTNPNLACCARIEYNTFSVKIQANNGKKPCKKSFFRVCVSPIFASLSYIPNSVVLSQR